jgi:hypothetical protein
MLPRAVTDAKNKPLPTVAGRVAPPEAPVDHSLGDLRFRALMSPEEWAALSPAIRQRFSKRLAGGNTIVFAGEILETRMSKAGWLLAQAARLIGGPLPVSRDAHVPSVVSVTEDMATGGQHWTRLYARRRTFPQVVHSSKRFAGPTGLEEYVGRGVGMALDVRVRDGVLLFCSNAYFFEVAGIRLALPAWLTPGAITVAHTECGDGRFTFTLDVVHPRFGELIHQVAVFRETRS